MTRRALYLLTKRFPFGEVEQFLEEEIHLFAANFDVTVVPLFVDGLRRPVPKTVAVDRSLADAYAKKSKLLHALSCAFDPLLYSEIFTQLKSGKPLTFEFLRRLVGCLIQKNVTVRWAKTTQSQPTDIYFSYWLSGQALGCGSVLKNSARKLFSRAHGFEVYGERFPSQSIPLQEKILEGTNGVFCVSESGAQELKRKFPQFGAKVKVARLGILIPPVRNEITRPQNFVAVSCSALVSVKRVDRIIRALAKVETSKTIVWHHFGGGPDFEKLTTLAQAQLPQKRFEYVFHGQVARRAVLEFYARSQVNAFLNTSASEGIPYAVLEAMSFAIPAICTHVGGVSEAVHSANGILVPNSDDPKFFKAAIEVFLGMNETATAMMRANARHEIEKTFSWDLNFRVLVDQMGAG